MIRTRTAWIPTALLCGVLVAGCGSSSSTTTATTSSTPAASTQPAPAATTTATTTGPTTPTTSAAGPAPSTAQLAAAVCKSTTAKAKLPASLKAKVEEICHDYATGNSAKALQKGREVCAEAVEAIPGNSAAKQTALEHCSAK